MEQNDETNQKKKIINTHKNKTENFAEYQKHTKKKPGSKT